VLYQLSYTPRGPRQPLQSAPFQAHRMADLQGRSAANALFK
jgi:hypothetical protein